MSESQRLGIVVSGSLGKGVEVKLDGSVSIEDMAVGRFVTIEGQKRRFFGMISEVSLGVTDPKLSLTPPDVADPFIAEVLAGTGTGPMDIPETVAHASGAAAHVLKLFSRWHQSPPLVGGAEGLTPADLPHQHSSPLTRGAGDFGHAAGNDRASPLLVGGGRGGK